MFLYFLLWYPLGFKKNTRKKIKFKPKTTIKSKLTDKCSKEDEKKKELSQSLFHFTLSNQTNSI